jgi:hypothetical protein
MNTALADSARPRAGWPSSAAPVWVPRHLQPHHGAVAGAEDVFDAEPEIGHGRDDHGHEIGGAARAVAVAEQLGQIVPDKGRCQELSGAVADGAVIDRVHGGADCGDGIVDHDQSVPDPDRCQCPELDLAGRNGGRYLRSRSGPALVAERDPISGPTCRRNDAPMYVKASCGFGFRP